MRPHEDLDLDDWPSGDAERDVETDDESVEARIALLEEENERLRDLYQSTRQATYRRSALALALLGGVALGGGFLFPAVRDVLFILGAIGLFGGILTYYLTPEQFVAADVAERVYDALAGNEAALVAELGLSETRLYVPADDGVTLFVPQHRDDLVPDPDAFEGPLVAMADAKGLALTPTGAPLFDEVERTLSGPLADEPAPLLTQLTDALAESLELVDGTDVDLDTDDGRATVVLRGSAYADGFDSPPASLLAVGLASGLDAIVRLETAPAEDGDFTVTCYWSV